jgi:hypothetical protein
MGSSASLNRSSKKNWVEIAGELPPYVREIARSIEKTGKTLERAIAIAISRIKVWATGRGVKPDTQAKAVKALAQWEALKAKNAARRLVKASVYDDIELAANLVCLTDFEDYLLRISVEDVVAC